MSHRKAHKEILATSGFILGIVLVVGIAIIWICSLNQNELREQLIRYTFYFLEATFFISIAGLVLARRSLAEIFKATSFHTLIALALVAMLMLALTAVVAPKTNRIFYDEDIYEEQGVNIALLHRAQLCNDANLEFGRFRCDRWEYNKWPSGYPYLLSLFYRLFGVNEAWAFLLNNAAMVVGVLLVFFIATLLFQARKAGLFAALAFAMIPTNAQWGNTAAVEPTAAVAGLLCIFLWLLFIQTDRESVLFVAVFTTVMALQFRLESLLLLPLIGLILVLYKPKTLIERRFWQWALLASILLLPLLGHYLAVRNEPWGTVNEARFSFEHLQKNFKTNFLYYFQNKEFPLFISLAAIIGAGWVGKWRQRMIVGLWFLMFWGVFLFFYAGSYRYGSDIRYSLVSNAPLAIFAGFGFLSITEVIKKWKPKWPVVPATICLLLGIFISFLPTIRAEGEEAWEARLDHKFAKELLAHLPENSIVFTHNPNMFILWGQNCAQMYFLTDDSPQRLEEYFKRYKGGVYLHWNYWCNTQDKEQVQFCQNVLDRFKAEEVVSKEKWWVRYTLYRLRLLEKNKSQGTGKATKDEKPTEPTTEPNG